MPVNRAQAQGFCREHASRAQLNLRALTGDNELGQNQPAVSIGKRSLFPNFAQVSGERTWRLYVSFHSMAAFRDREMPVPRNVAVHQ
jgi:hypothetical protein